MEERFLYHIWDEGHLTPDLRCISRKDLRVVYQGQFNTGRGPDFKNAIIELAGEQLRGDIEIHLKTTDWQAHNHHEDVYYNKVILHVVLKHNSPYELTILEDGSAVEILELEHQLSEDIMKLNQNLEIPATAAVYCDLLSAVDKDRLQAILHSAGIRRFEGKIKRFNTALSLSSFEQVFYEGIFEALGYSKNKLNTMQIAQSLPLAVLKEYRAEGMSAEELCAIYLNASGLLHKESAILRTEQREQILAAWEKQPFTATRLNIDWQLFRIRPQNHPIKRLLYIAPFIHKTLEEGLMQYFLRRVEGKEDLYKAFAAIWQEQSYLGEKFKLGKSLQNNIYLNIFLPVLCLWQRKMSGDTAQVMEAYRQFPGLQANYITRFMQRYLNSSQIKPVNSKAIFQQGLLDIYHRWCSWHLCEECKQHNKGV